jgi:hypothetical protein
MKEQDYLMIDLGLPSGIKWADRNIGAETPQDKGMYFSWGNVDGYTVDENGNTTDGYSFDSNTYATTLGGQYTGSTLDTEHDAATVNMGEKWRMPTVDETLELVENTDHYYIDENGNIVDESELDGSELRSICFVKKDATFDYNDRSNFIEFPFAGYCDGSLLGDEGLYGLVWSSYVDESDVQFAHSLNFNRDGDLYGDEYGNRYHGFSVRGVTSKYIQEERFNELKNSVLNNVSEVLIEKNRKYGNAALEPIGLFYKGDSATSITIRIDDKISRVKNAEVLRKNDMFDLLGYSLLLGISQNYWNIPEEYEFDEKVHYIINQMREYITFETFNQEKTIFQKTSRALFGLDCVLLTLEYTEFDEDLLNDFILNLVRYFIEIECDDFNDLKD